MRLRAIPAAASRGVRSTFARGVNDRGNTNCFAKAPTIDLAAFILFHEICNELFHLATLPI
jgi:hypothetical protein